MPFSQSEVDDTVRELRAAAIGSPRAALPTSWSRCREVHDLIPNICPRGSWESPLPSPYDRVRAAVERDGRVTFVDLRAPLLAAKTRERVYFQTDSHWNYNGAVIGYGEIMRAVQATLPPGTLPTVAPAPRPIHVPGVDFYSGDLVQMLGLPSRLVREDDVAPLGKVLGDTASRCARRIDKDEFPGSEYFVCDRPAAARGRPARLDGDLADSAAVGKLQPRGLRLDARARSGLIEREKPDIVIEEMVERSLHAPGAFPMK